MQFYYGDKMPLRILDEGEFWKLQEAEHTQVIRTLSPNLEAEFVHALQVWERSLSQTQASFVRFIEAVIRSGDTVSPLLYQQMMQLVQFELDQSDQFIALLKQLSAESEAIKSNHTAMTVLNKIRRESEYIIGIAQSILSKSAPA